jgi:hypothetical protein
MVRAADDIGAKIMQRSADRSEATSKAPRNPARQRRAARRDSTNPQSDVNAKGQVMSDVDPMMAAEDNDDAWAHQLELEQEQQAVEQKATKDTAADRWQDNYFTQLASIDVSEHVEKKGEFTYLSWAWAVDRLRKAYPDATWEVKRFDGAPYLKTDCGYFVEVAVTVNGVTLSQIHPVLDGRNRPIAEPNAFDINTSIQRCLVKAIALHGLGLYVYAGEDLPEGAQPATITEEQQANLQRLIKDVRADMDRFREYFKIEKLEDLPIADYQRAVNALEKKRKAA